MGTYTELKESRGWFAEFLDTYGGENGCQEGNQNKQWYFNFCNTAGFKPHPSHNIYAHWLKIGLTVFLVT